MRAACAIAIALLAGTACRSTSSEPLEAGGSLEDSARIELSLAGQQAFDEEHLREVVAPDLEGLERRSSLRAAVDDVAYSLELFYRGEGFPACTVDYETRARPDGMLEATLTIHEGPRVRVEGVRFQGNESYPADELKGFLMPRARRLLPDPPVWFSERRVRDAADGVVAFYRSEGYLDVRVELLAPDPYEGPWGERVTVHYRVEEGPRFLLRELRLTGGVPEVDRGLRPEQYLGRPVSPRQASLLRGRLRELYERTGYPDVRTELVEQVHDPSGRIDLELRILPGERVTITGVRVEGNERTDESRILGSLTLREGDRYDVAQQRRSFRNLYRLGAFSSVALGLEGEGPERDLTVRVEEAVPRDIYLEPGYGSYERLRLVAGLRERNLFGTARSLSIEGSVSELAQRAVIGLSDARFLDSDTSGYLSLFASRRQEPSFLTGDLGSNLTFARELREHLRLAASYQFRLSTVDADDTSDPIVQALADDVNISSLGLTPSWDTRDSPFFPGQGSLTRLTLEWGDEAIGSELDFLRGDWTLSHFIPLDQTSVLGLSWRGGVIVPTRSTDTIPLQERYFNGGENTVRSFKEDQLGPKDSSGNPTGGEAVNIFTVELRERIVGRLGGALFFDAGNVVLEHENYFDFADFRYAVGVGLRYALPVGPIRLDVGFNPDRRVDEDSYVIHLSVGLSF